jgi:hypothetical protein
VLLALLFELLDEVAAACCKLLLSYLFRCCCCCQLALELLNLLS